MDDALGRRQDIVASVLRNEVLGFLSRDLDFNLGTSVGFQIDRYRDRSDPVEEFEQLSSFLFNYFLGVRVHIAVPSGNTYLHLNVLPLFNRRAVLVELTRFSKPHILTVTGVWQNPL